MREFVSQLGLKGTDGLAKKARELGATELAQERAKLALSAFFLIQEKEVRDLRKNEITFLTPKGPMGYEILQSIVEVQEFDVIEELDDPTSEKSQEIKYMREGMVILNKLGFEESDNSYDGKYHKRLANGSLLIIQGFQEPFEYAEDSEEYQKGLRGIPDEASFDAVLRKGDDSRKSGSIRYSNLANYVNNHQIPYQESILNIKDLINEEISNTVDN